MRISSSPAQIFALGRRARDTLLGVPDRLAPILAGESDQSVIHRLLTEEERTKLGIGPGLVRLSVGLEDVADLEEALDHALRAAASSLQRMI